MTAPTRTAVSVPQEQERSNQGLDPGRWVRLGTAAAIAWFVVSLIAGVAYLTGDESAGFVLVGSVVSTIVWMPISLGVITPFSIWGAIVLVVNVGCGFRGVVLATTSDAYLLDFFLTGQTYSDLFRASVVLMLIVLILVSFYMVGVRSHRSHIPVERVPFIPSIAELNSKAGSAAITGLAGLGFIGSVLFIRATGGFANQNIRERRATISDTSLADDSFQSFGHWELLAGLGLLAFVLQLARVLYRRQTLSYGQRVYLAALFANGLLLNLYTTERAELIRVALSIVTLWFLSGRKLRLGAGIGVVLLVAVAATSLTNVRSGGNYLDQLLQPSEFASSVSATVVENRNWLDLGKSLLIIDAAGDSLAYENGSTISSYALGIVPRRLWPGKPLIAPGPIIGREIYGNRRSGVPPGFAGELVWNFGILGGLIATPLLGYSIGRLERFCVRMAASGPGGAAFLTSVGMVVGPAMVTVAIGRGILTLAMGILTFTLLRTVCRYGLRTSRQAPAH